MEWWLERGVVLHEKVLSVDRIFKLRDMNIQRQREGKEGGRDKGGGGGGKRKRKRIRAALLKFLVIDS